MRINLQTSVVLPRSPAELRIRIPTGWIVAMVVFGFAWQSPAQGTVRLTNFDVGAGLDAPVFGTDCTTRLAGSEWAVQLYAGPDAGGLVATGSPTPFFTGGGAGYFDGGEVAIPSVVPGTVAYVEIKVWNIATYFTFEEASQLGGAVGSSGVLSIQTEPLPAPPSSLLGLQSFCLAGGFVSPRILDISRRGDQVVVSFEGGGILESATNVEGPWIGVPAASSPYSELTSGAAQRFFRVRDDNVYSVNVVGYVNVALQAGDNYLSNPFFTQDDSFGALFAGVIEGSSIQEYDPATGSFNEYQYFFGMWFPESGSLNPGEGIIYRSPLEMVLTFVGEVPQGRLENPLPQGQSLRGSMAPVGGELLDFPAAEGDVIQTWNHASQSLVEHTYFSGMWFPLAPTTGLGEAFWVINNGTAKMWVQEYDVYSGGGGQFPPTITSQPQDQTVPRGETSVFTVQVDNASGASFQWSRDGVDLADDEHFSGARSDTLTINGCQPSDAGFYQVVVTNGEGSVTSTTGQLTVRELIQMQQVVAHSIDRVGEKDAYEFSAQGGERVKVYGADDGRANILVELRDAGGQLLTTVESNRFGEHLNASEAVLETGGTYYLAVRAEDGWSAGGYEVFIIDLDASPFIHSQPRDKDLAPGGTAVFGVEAYGEEPLSFQWRKDGGQLVDGGNISGATTPTLTLSNIQLVDAGAYDVVVSNDFGQSTSEPAILNLDTSQTGVLVEYWLDIAGGNLTALLEDPDFPENPDGWELVDFFEWPGDASGWGDNYGTRLRAFLVPPESGDYVFWISGDDECRLLLSTDAAPGNATAICRVPAWTPYRGWDTYPEQESSPIRLVAGQRYYVEALHKEGGGGDSVSVAWQLPSGTFEGPIPSYQLRAFEMEFVAPSIRAQPQDLILAEGDTAQFTVEAAGTPPLSFQWRKGGNNLEDNAAISGSTTGTLTLSNVQLADAGTYDVIVSNSAGRATSAPAELTVLESPRILAADHRGNPNGIRIFFSKPVNQDQATDPANYTLTGPTGELSVLSAVYLSDSDAVQLGGDWNFQPGESYEISIRNIPDANNPLLFVRPNPTTLSLSYGGAGERFYDFTEMPNDISLFGDAEIRSTGSHDGSGYLKINDAANSQNGAAKLNPRHDVDQFRVAFKAFVSAGESRNPADGFSFNVAEDIPDNVYPVSEEGYAGNEDPATYPEGLSVCFDNWSSGSSDNGVGIDVKYRGELKHFVALPKIGGDAAEVDGLPTVVRGDRWFDIAIHLMADGSLTIVYDGYTVMDQIDIGWQGIANAQIGLGARTGGESQSFWVDDLSLDLSDADVGPITVTKQPENHIDVPEDSPVLLSVEVGGSRVGGISAQWYKNGEVIPGATSLSYPLSAVPGAAGEYYVVVANEFSQATSETAIVAISTAPPEIIGVPEPQRVVVGQDVQFTVAAVGSGSLTFQWFKGDMPIPNATESVLSVSAVTLGDAGVYAVEVSNANGTVSSGPVELVVYDPVVVTLPPQSQTVVAGEEVIFRVGAIGTEPLTYQWRLDNRDIPEATEPYLDLGPVTEEDTGEYSVVVGHAFGSVLSDVAVLTVVRSPVIVEPPVGGEVILGDELQLQVQAEGTGPLEYQWRRNGNDIPGAQDPELTIVDFQPMDAGRFTVVVRNPYGVAESAEAVIRPIGSAVPVADFFADRGRLDGPEGVGLGDNISATREVGEPLHAGKAGGRSLWLSWQGETPGTLELSTDGSAFDTLLAVYTGANLTGLIELAANEDHDGLLTSRLLFHAQAGVEYAIAIDGFDGAAGDLVFRWSFEPDEVPLPVIVSQSESRVVSAGESVALEVLAEGLGLTWQWFKNEQVLPAETNPTILFPSFEASDVGIYMAVVGDQLGRVVESRPVRLDLGEAGQTLAVTKLGELWENGGIAQFRIASLVAAHGFTSVGAGVVGTELMSNSDAIREIGERNHCNDPRATGGSIWYGLTPESDGILFLDTEGSEIETVIAVYRGRDHETQTLLACSEAATDLPGLPRVALPVQAGGEYAVAIVGLDGNEGQVRLNWFLATTGHRVLDLELSGNGFQILESAPAGVVLELQRSRDMRTWQKLHRGPRNSGILKFLDKDIHRHQRWFYRVIEK